MQGKGEFCSDLSFDGIFQSFACLEHRRSGRRHLHRLTGAWIYDISDLCAKNIDALRERMDALHSKQERSHWENIVITMLEVLIEMRLRGIFVDMEAIASF